MAIIERITEDQAIMAVEILKDIDYLELRSAGERDLTRPFIGVRRVTCGSEATIAVVEVKNNECVVCKLPKIILGWYRYNERQTVGQNILENSGCQSYAPYTIGPVLLSGFPRSNVLCQKLIEGQTAKKEEIDRLLLEYNLQMRDSHVKGNGIWERNGNLILADLGEIRPVHR